MKVLHVITTIELGGAEKQLVQVCASQVKLGYEIEIVHLQGAALLRSQFNKLGITTNDFSEYSFIKQIFKFRKLVRVLRPTLVHAHLPRSEILCALTLPRKSFFVSRHNAELFWPGGIPVISSLLSRIVISKSIVCIAISHAVKNHCQKHAELPKSRDCVIINYGIGGNPKYLNKPLGNFKPLKILCIARLESQKDIPTLIRAVGIAKSNGLELQLQLVGSGSLQKTLIDFCSDLGLSHIVTFVGKVEKVESFYREADVLILPSQYEGFGMVYLESLANGLPVISSRNEAAKEIFGCDYELFFDVGDYCSLAQLIIKFSQEKSPERFTFKYNQVLKRFSADTMALKLDEIYRQRLKM